MSKPRRSEPEPEFHTSSITAIRDICGGLRADIKRHRENIVRIIRAVEWAQANGSNATPELEAAMANALGETLEQRRARKAAAEKAGA